MRTSCSAHEPGTGRWMSCPSRSGMCWSSVPPQATLRTCIPRQTPSSGMPRSSAPSARAISKRSRSGLVPTVSACASTPWASGSMSAPPPSTSASIRSSSSPGSSSARRSGGSIAIMAVGPVDRPRVGERKKGGGFLLPDAEGRRLDRGADSDQGACHGRTLAARGARICSPSEWCFASWPSTRGPLRRRDRRRGRRRLRRRPRADPPRRAAVH